MPSIDWVFLCDYAFIDASGKASIIGIFENIYALSLPIQHSQLYVALGMHLNPGDNFEISARLSSPSGKEITKINPQRIIVPTNAPGIGKGMIAFGFYTIPFAETGEYHIEIFVDSNSIHVIPLNMIIKQK